jgi:hypothetical protein
MTTTRTRTLTSALMAATVLGLTACSSESTGFPTGTSASAQPTADAPTTTGVTDTTATPDTTPPGDTADGPIVAPCSVTWAAFPAEVRPADATTTGTPTPPRPKENYALGCLFTNSTQPGYDPSKPARDGDFAARLTWGTGLDETTISQGAKPATWNGQDGGIRAHGTPAGTHCLAYASSGPGHAVVQIINKRFTTTEACDIADALMNALTTPSP